MTAAEFQPIWSAAMGQVNPIYLFQGKFQDRWFRIHSLPNSKRYADTPAEWQLLLQRQHTLFHDFLGAENRLLLLTGYYTHDATEHATGFQDFLTQEPAFSELSFTPLPTVDLHAFDSEAYDPGTHYWPLIAELALNVSQLHGILCAVADDVSRAVFIGERSHVLLAPYDGGVDIIVTNSQLRDHYRPKYSAWLSARADGL